MQAIPQVHVVHDLQFGSTGKGLLAGYLAKKLEVDTVVTAWSPNAGHTFIDEDGTKYIHTMLANGIVAGSVERVMIGPGSVVNLDNLMAEIEDAARKLTTSYGEAVIMPEILIHEHAAFVTSKDREKEAESMVGIGSTMKGSGAALVRKIGRDPEKANVMRQLMEAWSEAECTQNLLDGMNALKIRVISRGAYQHTLINSKRILVEGAQGFSLGINSGMYPYTTSRECTPAQILTDCAIPHHWLTKSYGVARCHPIRVANRYNESGDRIGWSGPFYPDSKELRWEDLGIDPELTTVTKLPRRIATFSPIQLTDAVAATGCDEIFLNFVNYIPEDEQMAFVESVRKTLKSAFEEHGAMAILKFVGTGPAERDIHELSEWRNLKEQGTPF